MSLNPFKCAIGVKRGELLEHVISTEGISIDGDKIEVIQKVKAPQNVKEL